VFCKPSKVTALVLHRKAPRNVLLSQDYSVLSATGKPAGEREFVIVITQHQGMSSKSLRDVSMLV
jgi:hypothetical protein